MPIFGYRCKDCNIEIEEFVKKHDDNVLCDKCGKTMIKLLKPCKYQFEAGDFLEPYIDTDIHPEGKPIKINNKQDFFNQCRKYGRGYRKISDRMR